MKIIIRDRTKKDKKEGLIRFFKTKTFFCFCFFNKRFVFNKKSKRKK
jgi:hypothetical protein